MIIRAATESDVPAIFDVRMSVRENRATFESLADLGVTPESMRAILGTAAHAWVAEEGGRTVGFAMVIPSHGSVFAIFVRPEFEGRGIGKALLARAEEWLFGTGREEIWLQTNSDPGARANGFYEHLGWTNQGVQRNGQLRYTKRRRIPADEGEG